MKLNLFRKNRKHHDIFPVSAVSLNLPAGVPHSRMLSDNGIWRKAACFGTINATIRSNPSLFSDLPLVEFMWSAKRQTKAGRTTIHCEQGWLPRSDYQISSLGVNQFHHVTRELRDASVTIPAATPEEIRRMRHLRLGFPPAKHPEDLCKTPFFLFALQLTTDLNLRCCGLELASVAGKPRGNETLLTRLSLLFAECAPNARVLFLQHPGEKITIKTEGLLQANHEYVAKSRKLRFLDLATSPNCLGVISINSNALNEAMLFSRPCFQMGDFLMRRFPNHQFPHSLMDFLQDPAACVNQKAADSYLAHLMRSQHSLDDLADPVFLRDLIIRETNREKQA